MTTYTIWISHYFKPDHAPEMCLIGTEFSLQESAAFALLIGDHPVQRLKDRLEYWGNISVLAKPDIVLPGATHAWIGIDENLNDKGAIYNGV